MGRIAALLAFISLASIASAGEGTLTRFTYTEYLMGVDARIIVYAPTQNAAVDACGAAFQRVADLDAMMSDYRQDSELMRLSTTVLDKPVRVSPELFKVLAQARSISRQSDGYFDVTVGPVVQLWRKARKTGIRPTREAIRTALQSVGWQKLELDSDNKTVKLDAPGMRLDLGAIGKGYAADEAQKILRAHGITRALVEMGGDITVNDPPPGKSGWTIRVPNAGMDMLFRNCAISSSGDTEEFVVIGGVRYSHVIDPHTGEALTNRVQATVIAPIGLLSDPLGTCMTLLDRPDRKRLLAAYPGVTAYVKKEPLD